MSTESDLIRSAEDLRAANQGAAQSAGDLAAKQSALSQATSAAAKSLSSLTGGLASGRTELTQLNQAYELAGQAAGRVIRGLGDLGSKIPIIGGLFDLAGKIGQEAANIASQGMQSLNTQLATVQKQFQAFGTIGALSAQGMSGLQDQITKSGMTMEGFQTTVLENSQALAAFAGTTSDGVARFSKIVQEITQGDIGDELRNIGMSADMIGQAAAGFLARETRQGRAQAMSNEQLSKGAAEYAKQLDMLARLTGQSADQIKRQQDAALSESRFRASIYELDEAAQKRVLNAQSMFARAPQLAQGIRDLVSGVGNTDAALKLVSLTGGAAADAVERLKSGQINEFQFREEMNAMLRQNIKMFADNAKYAEGSSEAFGDFAQILDLLNENVSGTASAAKGQKDLASTQDALTKSTVAATKSMEQLSIIIRTMALAFLPLAAKLNQEAAAQMAKMANAAAEAMGSNQRVRVGPDGQVTTETVAPPATGNQQSSYAPSIPGGILSGRPQAQRPQAGAAQQLGMDALQGLNVTSQGERGGYDPRLIDLARKVADFYPGVRFTSFNDSYHRSGKHTQGLALDFALPQGLEPNIDQGREIIDALTRMGFESAKDEYNFPSERATGGHIHAELARGGIVSGPRSGYAATLHGTEAVVPLPDGRSIPVQTSSIDQGMQMERLDTIISLMREQTENSRRLMSYAS